MCSICGRHLLVGLFEGGRVEARVCQVCDAAPGRPLRPFVDGASA